MTDRAHRAITFAATATDSGRVEFDVDRVGTFTLAFGSSGYPYDCDDQRLEVAYGRWDDEESAGRLRELPDAPVINGVRLAGGSFFDPNQALAHLRDLDDPWCGWLSVYRRRDGHSEMVPWRTKDRVVFIVARLVEAFLDRDDVAELLAAHRAHHAPARIARHRENLRAVGVEIREWLRRQALEESQLQRQLGFADLSRDEAVADPGSPPWRDYATAATRDGEAFLIATVGATRPR